MGKKEFESEITNVEKELNIFSGVVRGRDELDASYLDRLLSKVDDLLDKDEKLWDTLSGEAQMWVNSAVNAMEKGASLPSFNPEKDKESKIKVKRSVASQVRHLLCEHPNWGARDVEAALKEEGIEPKMAGLSVTVSECKATMAILRKMGKLRD